MTPKSTLILLSILIGFFGGTWAQESGLVWPNTYRLQMDNPVLSGFDGQNHLYLGTYQKWLGTPDGPSTSFVGASLPIVGRLIGMGGFLVRDQIGLLTQTRASVYASAHSSTEGNHRFSIGTGISWQGVGVATANVIDPLSLESFRGSRLNLGLGLNYRGQLGNPGSWINLQVQIPQLFRSIELTAPNSGTDFLYTYRGQFILQANMRYLLGSGNALVPSLLIQSQGLKDGQGGYLIDAGLGFSVRNDALQFRLGVRNAPASLLYAGIGVQLGNRINVAATWEPVGPLGMSMGADLDLIFGDSVSSPSQATWYPKSFWEQKLNDQGLTGYFEVNTVDTKKTIFVNYRFDDYDDLRYKLVEDEQLRLDDFFTQLESAIKEVRAQGGKLVSLTINADMEKEFEQTVVEPYSGSQPISIKWYYLEGVPVVSSKFKPGDSLTHAQLTAIKLYYFKEALASAIPSIPQDVMSDARLQIERDPGVEYSRRITVKLEFEK